MNDGKGESTGSDVTISPEGRRSRSNGAITDSSKRDTICFTGQRKQQKREPTPDEQHSVLMAELDD